MRVLVTGAGGLLGSTLCRSIPEHLDVVGIVRNSPAPAGIRAERAELNDGDRVESILERVAPDVVIHTAYSISDLQRDVVDATTSVAMSCAAHGVALVHLSSDALFDGQHAQYSESDDPSPIHDYGRSKAAAEATVRRFVADAAIVRTSLIIGIDPLDGTSAWMVEALRRGERVQLFTDELRQPMLVEDLAASLWAMVALPRADRGGVWHIMGPDVLARDALGRELCRIHGLDAALIDAVASPSAGPPRPKDLTMVSRRAHTLGVAPRPISSVVGHG